MFINFTFYDDDQQPIKYRIWAKSIGKSEYDALVLTFQVGSFYVDTADLHKHLNELLKLLYKWDNCWILYGKENGTWDWPDVSLCGSFVNDNFAELRFA